MNIRAGKSDIISKTNDIHKAQRQSSEFSIRLYLVDKQYLTHCAKREEITMNLDTNILEAPVAPTEAVANGTYSNGATSHGATETDNTSSSREAFHAPRNAQTDTETIEELATREYKYGFVTDIETETIARGLNEDVIRLISSKKNEPEWLLEWRLKAYRQWLRMEEGKWANVQYADIDFQDITYYSAPKQKKVLNSLDEVDPELLKTFDKLGISLNEQKRLTGVAVDAVFDSVSVATTFKGHLKELGIIFCSFSEAVQEHPELVQKYLGSVVPAADNFYAALNSAVFSDGSFCYIPKGVRCPMELSTYFRINTEGSGQFERTLIVADEGAYVSYLEGCTAPQFDTNQLHAAVVEIVAMERAEVKYSTVQNWYPGDENGKGGIYNFVTKRGACRGDYAKISWTQVETGSAITWKYPSVLLQGDHSVGEFYSVAVTNNMQQADTGTKMIHIGKNTRSTIVSKGISAGRSQNSYRGLVKVLKGADNARNFSQCDSLLIGDKCGAHTFPYIEARNPSAKIEHEASTSKVGEDQIFYLNQRGISTEDAVSMIVNGFCKEVFRELPMEFAVEAQKLLGISLEGSVG
jgi:Fe-S cluster assembly protein SufB